MNAMKPQKTIKALIQAGRPSKIERSRLERDRTCPGVVLLVLCAQARPADGLELVEGGPFR
jgi:hypothetical protein